MIRDRSLLVAGPFSFDLFNPNFAEWLMGWPPGWSTADPTACGASETALWRCKLQSQLSCLLGDSESREAA